MGFFTRKKRNDPKPVLETPTVDTVDPALDHGTVVDSETLRLVEEQLDVSKLNVPGDTLRVSTVTDEYTETVAMNLRKESYDVVRVSIDQPVDTVPEIRREDGVTIIPVMEERLVVTKQLVLVEELHIREDHAVIKHSEPVTIRKQRAVIEREGALPD